MVQLSPHELETLNHYVDLGWIRKQSHPDFDLSIYTYSTTTELERHWDKYTLMSRGLVVNSKGRVVIRCVPKFFNSGQKNAEHVLLNDPNTEITMKNDGYLIQIKKDHEYGLIVTSKGSFISNMVIKAKELINEDELKEDYTYICELCCNFPGDEAIIVKRWEEPPKLVVWAIMNENGEEVSIYDKGTSVPNCLERVQRFDYETALEYMKRNDVEGVVGKNGTKRVKFKTDHFMMMHRLISDIRKVRVWEVLSQGLDLDCINIPDEFMPVMKQWREELLIQRSSYLEKAEAVAKAYETDRELALSEEEPFIKKLAFNIRKGKDNEKIIWRKIRQQLKEET